MWFLEAITSFSRLFRSSSSLVGLSFLSMISSRYKILKKNIYIWVTVAILCTFCIIKKYVIINDTYLFRGQKWNFSKILKCPLQPVWSNLNWPSAILMRGRRPECGLFATSNRVIQEPLAIPNLQTKEVLNTWWRDT